MDLARLHQKYGWLQYYERETEKPEPYEKAVEGKC
jgi:hypothetical protein